MLTFFFFHLTVTHKEPFKHQRPAPDILIDNMFIISALLALPVQSGGQETIKQIIAQTFDYNMW